jgi:hypothetical protein
MLRLISTLSRSPVFAAHNVALVDLLRARTAEAALGGPETARARHKQVIPRSGEMSDEGGRTISRWGPKKQRCPFQFEAKE